MNDCEWGNQAAFFLPVAAAAAAGPPSQFPDHHPHHLSQSYGHIPHLVGDLFLDLHTRTPSLDADQFTDNSNPELNLAERTFFSSPVPEPAKLEHGFRRPIGNWGFVRGGGRGGAVAVRCQAEGCESDLTRVKHYHRRHKVCEFHSKAATVLVQGLKQRFCQQCSRFHVLAEFDQGKRSCRKRLAIHNRRRRKSQPQNRNPNHSSLSPTDAISPSFIANSMNCSAICAASAGEGALIPMPIALGCRPQ